MPVGVIAYGTYIPYHRLKRSTISEALGISSGKGARSVAGYDEDTTSMAVEAARPALAGLTGSTPANVYFGTTQPAYADKTNATAVHAALGLDESGLAVDMVGSVRSAIGVLQAAFDAGTTRRTLAVLSDIRSGLPASADEREGGDAAASFVVGSGSDVVAELLGSASMSREFLDRWRQPGEIGSRTWEERFGEHAYLPMVSNALTEACKQASISPDEVDHLVIAGTHARVQKQLSRLVGVRPGTDAPDIGGVVGNCGAAQLGLLLADVLDRAREGATIMAISVCDGVDVVVFRTTSALRACRDSRASAWSGPVTVRDQITNGNDGLRYAQFLTWRSVITREPPRRPDPERPSGPPSLRREAWKFGFNASRCQSCGMRHLPPGRVCLQCKAVDRMEPERLADVRATIATFTIDRLAYSPSPPMVVAVVDFDGGGRYHCELTDVAADDVHIGDRVEMTFRRLFTAGGVHDYFWKARPVRERADRGGDL
jgi:3-hydroxy-3-methylglutaryl CoA synthase/uncharacterized OB-fold protein